MPVCIWQTVTVGLAECEAYTIMWSLHAPGKLGLDLATAARGEAGTSIFEFQRLLGRGGGELAGLRARQKKTKACSAERIPVCVSWAFFFGQFGKGHVQVSPEGRDASDKRGPGKEQRGDGKEGPPRGGCRGTGGGGNGL